MRFYSVEKDLHRMFLILNNEANFLLDIFVLPDKVE